MPVLVVVITRDVELRHLCTALAAHRLSLAVLLAHQCLNAELTELQIGLDTKQCLTAANQRTRKVHRHVTRLDTLDDVVLFAFVVQFQVLLVERKRSLRVVGQVEVQFRTHFTLHARLDLLIKVKNIIVSRARGQ